MNHHLPSFCYNTYKRPIKGIAIHYLSVINVDPENWDDPQRCWELFHDMNLLPEHRKYDIYKGEKTYASADVLILRDGTEWDLAPRGYRTWHAGKSQWRGRENCNDFMMGVELIAAPQVSRKYGFTDSQYVALARRCRREMEEGDFGIEWIAGHDQIAPGRKQDPGPTFNYERLFKMIQPSYDLDGG